MSSTKSGGKEQKWGQRANQPQATPSLNPQPNDWVSKLDAITFLAERVIKSDEQPRDAKGRVRNRIDTAIKKCELKISPPDELNFSELVNWARSKRDWTDLLKDVPSNVEARATALESKTKFGTPREYEAPTEIGELRDAFHKAQKRIQEVEQQVSELTKENAELRPKAERFARISVSNTANARLTRPREK